MESVVVKKFLNDNKYVMHPELIVKDSGSYAVPPYLVEYGLTSLELLDKIFYLLQFSQEGNLDVTDPKIRLKEYLKGFGVKTMKDLYLNTISMDIYVENGLIIFTPWENKGPKVGFSGLDKDLTVKISLDSPKEELVKGLELALSRCK